MIFDRETAKHYVAKSNSCLEKDVDHHMKLVIKKIKIAASLGFSEIEYKIATYTLDVRALLLALSERLYKERNFSVKINKKENLLVINWK